MSDTLQNLIKQGESQIIEFKQTWRDEYLKTICAFANTDGGEMWIGGMDNGSILGIENADRMRK